jgi:hypothetical protein
VLFPEPVGPMTLEDIKLVMSPSRVISRTLSQYHLFPGPLCSPSQEIFELSECALCLSQVVVLRWSGVEGAPSQEVPRLPAGVLGLSDGTDGALYLSEAGSPPSQEVLRNPEKILELSGGTLCLSHVVVLRQSGEGTPSQEAPRLPAEVLGLSDGALCLSEVVVP